MLEIDRWALARAAELQAEMLAHYEVYEFHPVVAKLQVFCSEDLGAFYLDVLKDRLYTTADSLARRSAQTALWQITQAMLRWMAPFLSFTAEEAWQVFAPGPRPRSSPRPTVLAAGHAGRRAAGQVGTHPRGARRGQQGDRSRAHRRRRGLVAAGDVTLAVPPRDHALLASLGEDLKFVFITSKATLLPATALKVTVTPSSATKCERCWHWRDDVGARPGAPRRSAAAAQQPARRRRSAHGRLSMAAAFRARRPQPWPWLAGLALLVVVLPTS
jgi:isoleucyl-tRNA synthetase